MKRSGAPGIRLAAVLGFAFVAAIIGTVIWQSPVLSRHDRIQQLQDLPLNSSVHLIGVVSYADQPGGRFWIQDETGAIPIDVSPAAAGVRVGETVSVRATKTARYDSVRGPVSVNLRSITVSPSAARVRVPQPFPVSLATFPDVAKNGVRIQTSGILRSVAIDSDGAAHLSVADSGPETEVIVANPGRDYSALVDSRLRIVGVPEQLRTSGGTFIANRLWVPSGDGLHVEQPPSSVVPVFTVRSLYRSRRLLDGHLIRMRGRVAHVASGSVLLEDRWGAVECHFTHPFSIPLGSIVEAEGFPSQDGLGIDLYHSSIQPVPSSQAGATPDDPGPGTPLLTDVAAIRGLSSSAAAQALPVEITGVITYMDPLWHQIYVQDRTAGIFIKYPGDDLDVAAGDRVVVVGITGAGNFAPVIVAPRFRLLGAAPLPAPVPVTSENAAAGLLDSQYVSIEGVVHPLQAGDQSRHPALSFELLSPVGQVHVYTSPRFPDVGHSRDLEDARVLIRGVFGTVFNARRQLVGYQLNVESRSDIDVIEPPVDPSSMETTPIGSLLRFSPHARFGHRVRVEGIATLVEPDFLYLEDSTDGVEIRGNTRGIHLGAQVDAVGYPALVGRYSPVMTDAVFHPTGRTGSVAPARVTAESLLQGHQDSMLVTLDGRLLMALDGPSRRSLVLQSGVRTFTAQLDTSDLGAALLHLQPGSLLRLTGVVSAQVDPQRLYRILEEDPSSFQILLRSPSDAVLIGRAPFWTLQSTLALLAVLSLLTVAILMWVGILRRRVRQQGTALRKASETAQAIRDLSAAMQNVSTEDRFDTPVSVQGSEEIAQLVVGFNDMLSELRLRDRAKHEAEARLQHMALIDDLTGLPNRRLLSDRLSQCLAKARREQRMVALLYMDLDGFKLVNDSLGHGVGDVLLTQVAQRLKSRFRQSDTLARIGGDEFTLILDDIQNKDDCDTAAQGLIDVLKAPFEIGGHSIRIAASVGISFFPDHGLEAGQLLQQADCAMYAAKRNGKNCIVQFGDDLGSAARERLTLEGELRRAIAEGEIAVHYQPEFDLTTGAIVRFEALARWTHPTLGFVPPLTFIPVAEECGLIIPLGAYVMEQACRDAAAWQSHTDHPVQVAVNVSSVQFGRETFIDEVEEILHRTGLSSSLLQIELTESATLTGIERAADSMRRLRSMGISVAMDDFGTGYSCLSYLPRLAFDALKVDRSFVNELMVRPETRAFVRSILTLAHNLQMKVIVEGIETREQLELTRSLGANEAQGYLLGRPSPFPLEQLRLSRSAWEAARGTELVALEEVSRP